eukprot:scaffold104068_cov105-Phaeocystis_antarctica.AAC.3
MLAIVLMAPQALLNPFGPPRWNARRRLANRIERAALKESLNAQQGLLEYERERLKLSALSVWTDWYTSPFALSEVSRTARRPPIWPRRQGPPAAAGPSSYQGPRHRRAVLRLQRLLCQPQCTAGMDRGRPAGATELRGQRGRACRRPSDGHVGQRWHGRAAVTACSRFPLPAAGAASEVYHTFLATLVVCDVMCPWSERSIVFICLLSFTLVPDR